MSSNKKPSIRLPVPRTSLGLFTIGAGALPFLVALALSAAGGGCTTFDGLTATAAETTSSGVGGTTTSTGGSAAGGTGGSAGTGSTGGAGGMGAGGGAGGAGGAGASCADPQLKGPAMVMVATKASPAAYCIDSTEVTRAQYSAFLDTGPELNQPAPCDANDSFVPTVKWPPLPPQKDLPVVGVDFCDAAAFCAWAGKRLCGAVGGGTIDTAGADDPSKGQWINACGDGGAQKYPYGNEYDSGACNGFDYGAGKPVKVQNAGGCEGGIPGIFDMSGNVREWEDACTGSDCRVRGGSFDSSGAADGELPCGGQMVLGRLESDEFTGFRCCRD